MLPSNSQDRINSRGDSEGILDSSMSGDLGRLVESDRGLLIGGYDEVEEEDGRGEELDGLL